MPRRQKTYYGQNGMLFLMRDLGYTINYAGMCHGFTIMAIQAFLTGTLDQFNRRIHLIHNEANKIKHWDRKFKTRFPKNAPLTKDEQTLLDIKGFFEGVQLMQAPSLYKDIYGKFIRQPTAHEGFNTILSQIAEIKGGISFVDGWTTCFTREEMPGYFRAIRELAIKHQQSLAFKIGTSPHVISFFYDYKTDKWLLGDSNKFPVHVIPTDKLTDEIFSSHFHDRNYILPLRTEILALSSNHDSVKTLIEELRADQRFQRPNKLNHFKATVFASSPNNLAKLAIFNCDVPLLKNIKSFHDLKSMPEAPLMLNIALSTSNLELITELLDAGVNPNIYLNGRSAVQILIEEGKFEIAKLLIKHGAEINFVNSNGLSLLHYAVLSGNLDLIRFFCQHPNISINNKNADGTSAAIAALLCNNEEALKCLIFEGIDLNVRDNSGQTIAHEVIKRGNLSILLILKNAGVDFNVKSHNGITPMHIAAQKGRIDLIKALVSAKADINAQDYSNLSPLDSKGKTPLDFAMATRNQATIEYLKSIGARSFIRKNNSPTFFHQSKVRIKQLDPYLNNRAAPMG